MAIKTKRPLPSWAKAHPERENTIIADPDLFYPAILGEYADMIAAEPADYAKAYPPLTPKKPNKYWIEVAYQTMKLDLQIAVGRFGFTILVDSRGGRKQKWSLRNMPGQDADVTRATKSLEARNHYRHLRGGIPR